MTDHALRAAEEIEKEATHCFADRVNLNAEIIRNAIDAAVVEEREKWVTATAKVDSIATKIDDLEKLLASERRLHAELVVAAKALPMPTEIDMEDIPYCICCGAYPTQEHATTCEWAIFRAALAKLEGK